MFTGIITCCGRVDKREEQRLYIKHNYSNVVRGESIAVNGVCLTVIQKRPDCVYCDISSETLLCTNLGALQVGKAMNLERALSTSDRLGGHFVSGHIDQVGEVALLDKHCDFTEMTIVHVCPENQSYLSPKGSIAVNGVSLTINRVFDNGFNVMLIPETLRRTNLSDLQLGDKVNLEFDMLAKMVARQLAHTIERSTFSL